MAPDSNHYFPCIICLGVIGKMTGEIEDNGLLNLWKVYMAYILWNWTHELSFWGKERYTS